jgi:hypothetical protein
MGRFGQGCQGEEYTGKPARSLHSGRPQNTGCHAAALLQELTVAPCVNRMVDHR